MANETVLVLGGGVGGLVTATELRKRLNRDQHVVLIDRTGIHTFQPSLLWLMVGTRRSDQMLRDLGSLEDRGIELIRGTIQAIDPERKTVRLEDGQELQGDAIVVSLGAELAPERVPGLAESGGDSFFSMDGAQAVNRNRQTFTQGRLALLVASMPFKCPAAPYEAAMLLEHDLRRRGVRDQVEVSLYTPEPGPMGVAGPEVSAAVRGLVEQRGIAYHPQHAVAEVDAQGKGLVFSDGSKADYDWLVYVAPHTAPVPVQESGLTNDSGWVSVNPTTLETQYPGVYAIGDVTTIPVATGAPLPKAGVFADHEAKVVANNIAFALTGKGSAEEFHGDGG